MAEFTPAQIDKKIESDPEMKRLAKDDETEFLSQHAKIYREFGYQPDGTPLRTAQKAIKGISKFTGLPEEAVRIGAATPLAVGGTIAGATVGAAGGPGGAIIGAAGGSILGEAANSLLGINEPMSTTDFGIAGGAALVPTAISKTIPGLIKAGKYTLPGVGAGLNELAGERFATALKSLRVTPQHVDDARAAMGLVTDFKVETPKLKALLQSESKDVARQEVLGVPSTGHLKDLNNQIEALSQHGSLSFRDIMTLEKGFGRIKDTKSEAVWAKAAGVLIEDLEFAVTNPKLSGATKAKAAQGLNAFKQFIATNNKMKADDDMVSLLGRVVKPTTGDPNLVQIDRKMLMHGIEKMENITKAYTPAEIQSMKDVVTDLGYISKPPSTGGDAVNLAKRYGVGGMIGWMTAGPMGAFAGAGVEELMRKGITTETGRRIVKYLAKEGRGTINSLELEHMLGKAAAGVSAAVPGVTGMGSPLGTQSFENQE